MQLGSGAEVWAVLSWAAITTGYGARSSTCVLIILDKYHWLLDYWLKAPGNNVTAAFFSVSFLWLMPHKKLLQAWLEMSMVETNHFLIQSEGSLCFSINQIFLPKLLFCFIQNPSSCCFALMVKNHTSLQDWGKPWKTWWGMILGKAWEQRCGEKGCTMAYATV